MLLIEYRLTADALCMGEVVKGGILKPCCRTVRYSTITGALRRNFGNPDLHACGYLVGNEDGHNRLDCLVYSPRDRAVELSKVPLEVEFLTNVLGRVFVVGNDAARALPREFELAVGAMLSKGFGSCRLVRVTEHGEPNVGPGILRTRIPMKHLRLFDVRQWSVPVHGYQFEPHSLDGGEYVLSLFEGSEVVGPELLLERRPNGRH